MKGIENKKEEFCQCSRCERTFARKWSASKRRFPLFNEVSYWTEKKGWSGYELLCKHCLKDWFEKENDAFVALIPKNKKRIFYNYYSSGFFDKTDNESFVNKWKKK